MKKKEINGYPAFFLCIVPMIVGYVVIIKATLGALL